MLEVSRTSIKKADQDLENICFYSLGWPTGKQLIRSKIMMIHMMIHMALD